MKADISEHLTKLGGEFRKSSAVPGMAYFSGTGPDGTFCHQCAELNNGKRPLDTGHTGRYAKHHCNRFRLLAGMDGPKIEGGNPSCKYFVDLNKGE
jgi:hypothetical protein